MRRSNEIYSNSGWGVCIPERQHQTEATQSQLHQNLRRSGRYPPVEHRGDRMPIDGIEQGALCTEFSDSQMRERPVLAISMKPEMKEAQPLPEENMNLSCSICFEEFRWPKSLSCGHTFCVPCIENMVDRAGLVPSLQCPTCRRDVDFPESGETEDLATNFSLLAIINDNGQSRGATGDEGKTQNKCEVHSLVNKLYCQSCKVPVCVNCTLNEHEVGEHDIITKKAFVKDQRARVDELSKKLPGIKAAYTEIETKFNERREQHRRDTSQLEESVQAALEEKQKQLAADAAALLKEIKESITGTEERNLQFSQELDVQEELFKHAEQATADLTGELDAQNFADETKISQISNDLVEITNNMGKLDEDFRLLPQNPRLHFEPSAHQEKVGHLHILAEEMQKSDDEDLGYEYNPVQYEEFAEVYDITILSNQ